MPLAPKNLSRITGVIDVFSDLPHVTALVDDRPRPLEGMDHASYSDQPSTPLPRGDFCLLHSCFQPAPGRVTPPLPTVSSRRKKSLSPHPVHESTGAVSQAMRAKAPVETLNMQTYLASATGQNSTPTDRVTCSNTNRGLMCTRAHQGVLRMLIARRITPKANPKRCVIHLWP